MNNLILELQSNISAFVHPLTGKVILENNEFDIRKSICDKAYEIYKNDDYKFKNQSITQLSMNLFKNMVGKLEKSTYNSLVNNILNEYAPKPFTEGYMREYTYFGIAFDNYKSYSTVLYNNKANTSSTKLILFVCLNNCVLLCLLLTTHTNVDRMFPYTSTNSVIFDSQIKHVSF